MVRGTRLPTRVLIPVLVSVTGKARSGKAGGVREESKEELWRISPILLFLPSLLLIGILISARKESLFCLRKASSPPPPTPAPKIFIYSFESENPRRGRRGGGKNRLCAEQGARAGSQTQDYNLS